MSDPLPPPEPHDAPEAEYRAWYDAVTLERLPPVAVVLVVVHLLHLVGFLWLLAPTPAERGWQQGIVSLHAGEAVVVGVAGLWASRVWRSRRQRETGRWVLVTLFVTYLAFGALVTAVDQLRGLPPFALLTVTVGVAAVAEFSLAEAIVAFGATGVLAAAAVWVLQPEDARRVTVAVNAVAMVGVGFGVSQVLTHRRRAGWQRQQEVEAVTRELSLVNDRLREEIERRMQIEAELEVLANRDPLTSLQNRRGFLAALREVHPSSRGDGLLLMDLDHFKLVNDALGHAAGDQTLIDVAGLLTRSVRTDDVVARLGGEELAILLPHTPLGEAERLANRLREAIASAGLGRPESPLTVSFGVAMARDGEAWEQWLARADAALYAAKASGRNRVCVARESGNGHSA